MIIYNAMMSTISSCRFSQVELKLNNKCIKDDVRLIEKKKIIARNIKS